MKQNWRQKTAFILALLLLLTTVSCADGQDGESKSETENKASTPGDTTESESGENDEAALYAPDLPEVNYDGYAFRIITRDDSMHPYPLHTRDIVAEEITGEGMNDAVYYRNLKIEEDYGFVIKMEAYSETVNEHTPDETVRKSVLSNSDEYDLLLGHMIYVGSMVTSNNVLLNWNLLPYVDFDKPYWNRNAYNAFSVGDKSYMALSDMCVSSNDNAHCMVFNKDLAEAYNVGSLYDLVYANEWTYDKFIEVIADVSNDMDGNGIYDEKDRYGYLLGGDSSMINWMYAADCSVTRKDENNIPYLALYSERTVSAYEWLYNLMHTDDIYMTSSWVELDGVNMFSANQALIMSTQIAMFEHLRSMDSDFGVLPFPKFDAEQENYAHYVDGHSTVMAIPKTVSDFERTGIFLEAISYEGFRQVLPVYYDVILTTKYMRDQDSKNMLEIVYNSRAFDFAYVYDGMSVSFCFKRAKESSDFTSYYKMYEKVESKLIDRVIKSYEKNP